MQVLIGVGVGALDSFRRVIVVLVVLLVVGVQVPLREVINHPWGTGLLQLQHLTEPFTIPGNVLAKVRKLPRLQKVLVSVPLVQLALPEASLEVVVVLMLLLLLSDELLPPYFLLKSPFEVFDVLFKLENFVSLSSEKFFHLLFHLFL
jgi:hypothetical protein